MHIRHQGRDAVLVAGLQHAAIVAQFGIRKLPFGGFDA